MPLKNFTTELTEFTEKVFFNLRVLSALCGELE
jgi:hypothetical protein